MIILFLYLSFLLGLMLFLMFISLYNLSLIYSSFKGSPYVATRKKRVEEILAEAGLKKGKVFMELGSGDGRVVKEAVEKYGVRGIGVDINPLLVFWARFLARKFKDKIYFVRKNIFDVNLREADYLYLFLMPKLIEKLTPKMEKELRKGTIVISHGFPVKKWTKKLYKKITGVPFITYYYKI